MKDIRARLLALEEAHSPDNCIACAVRRLQGGAEKCPDGHGCSEPGKSWVDHIKEVDALERQRKPQTAGHS